MSVPGNSILSDVTLAEDVLRYEALTLAAGAVTVPAVAQGGLDFPNDAAAVAVDGAVIKAEATLINEMPIVEVVAADGTAAAEGAAINEQRGLEEFIRANPKEAAQLFGGLAKTNTKLTEMSATKDETIAKLIETSATKDAERAAERQAEQAERAAERQAEQAERAAERQAEQAERAAERKAEEATRQAERKADEATRQAERQADKEERQKERQADKTPLWRHGVNWLGGAISMITLDRLTGKPIEHGLDTAETSISNQINNERNHAALPLHPNVPGKEASLVLPNNPPSAQDVEYTKSLWWFDKVDAEKRLQHPNDREFQVRWRDSGDGSTYALPVFATEKKSGTISSVNEKNVVQDVDGGHRITYRTEDLLYGLAGQERTEAFDRLKKLEHQEVELKVEARGFDAKPLDQLALQQVQEIPSRGVQAKDALFLER